MPDFRLILTLLAELIVQQISEVPGINSVQTNNTVFVKYKVYVVTTENATQFHLGKKR